MYTGVIEQVLKTAAVVSGGGGGGRDGVLSTSERYRALADAMRVLVARWRHTPPAACRQLPLIYGS